ncbi:MAG TPA: AAA family ATPase [Ktedonobacterales bacterium]|nr:AAA family ATPase [Ktedonobacterales bacterium]
MATDRNTVERSIDRSLDDFGRFLRRRWWAVLIVALILLYILTQWVPLIIGSPPQPGDVLAFVIQIVFVVFLILIQFVALFWFLGRPRIYWVLPGETGYTFADYKGNPEVLEAARRIVTLMRGVRGFKEMGGEISRGLLLVGPPGTGKSYLAQCISTEADVPFAYASAASFRAMFIGMDVLMIKNLYRKARRLAREYGGCIIFMDEFDAIGMSRGGANGQGGMGGMGMGAGGFFGMGGTGGLNELLMQMDPPPINETWWRKALKTIGMRTGRAQREPVLTIGATNIPESLDPALLRPGRFDRKIVVAPPTDMHRSEVIEYYLNKVRHDDIPLHKLVSDMMGYTPVAIKHVINEAVVIAHFDGRDSISYHDIAVARETHEYGIRYPRTLSALEKRRLAYHEAGHAIAQAFLLPRFRVAHATIVKRLGSSGEAFVEAKPLEEIVTQSAEEVFARIQVSLASRAAEELFLNARLNGVGGDLANATQLALQYVAHWGMGDTFFSAAATMAPERMYTDPILREQAEKLLRQAYTEVRALLERRRKALIAVAEALLEREELDSDEIEQLIQEAETPPQEQVAALAEVAASALAQIPAFAPPSLLGAPPNPPPATVDAIPAPAAEPAAHEVSRANGANGANGTNGAHEAREARDVNEEHGANGHAPEAVPEVMPEAVPEAPAANAFIATPSQELHADRIVDRAILRAPRITRPIQEHTDPNLPTAPHDGQER